MTTAPPRPDKRPSPWNDPRLIFPDEATWAALSADAREAVIERILAVLDEYQEAMSEGTRHFRRKVGIGAELDGHFRRAGRGVYIGSELAVFYPGEPVIVPDVLAVMDCDPDIEPESWVVVDQGRGIDVVIEVRNQGKKHKDLVENVKDYARRRIPEYFSFDCRSCQLRGWRLATPSAQTYQPIVPQGGYLLSRVLGLELGVFGTRLRFFSNQALVPDATELVARLQTIADEQLVAINDTTQRLNDTTLRLNETTQRLHDVLDVVAAANVAMARAILVLCEARGVSLSADQHARLVAESDAATLSRWLTRATDVSSADALFAPW